MKKLKNSRLTSAIGRMMGLRRNLMATWPPLIHVMLIRYRENITWIPSVPDKRRVLGQKLKKASFLNQQIEW